MEGDEFVTKNEAGEKVGTRKFTPEGMTMVNILFQIQIYI